MSFEKSDSPSTPPLRLGIYPDVCVVMVTYSPDSSFDENVRALLPQVGKLIIVDNQSVPAARLLIVQAAASGDVEVIWNEQNLGIAAGSNKEIERALSSGQFSWIVTFDQDSRAPADYVAAIFAAYSACPFRVRLASSELTMMASTQFPPKRFIFSEIKTATTRAALSRPRCSTPVDDMTSRSSWIMSTTLFAFVCGGTGSGSSRRETPCCLTGSVRLPGIASCGNDFAPRITAPTGVITTHTIACWCMAGKVAVVWQA